MLAFAGQIYGDFSGYTDMAIGLALLLGFQIPLNFRVPYFAVSPVDFWRRWHISLSTWLRDYLYISLGGNRTGGRFRNVMITHALGRALARCGLDFRRLGCFSRPPHHRQPRVLEGALVRGLPRLELVRDPHPEVGLHVLPRAPGLGALPAQSLGEAFDLLATLHSLGGPLPAAGYKAGTILALTVAVLVLAHLMDFFVLRGARKLEDKPWLFWILLVLGQALCLFIGEPSNEFIYFQF